MGGYDAQVHIAKSVVTKAVLNMENKEERVRTDMLEMGMAVDDLNKAWDELTTCLVRQREERDRIITGLINELAEAKKE